jgi:hypothetical protein
MTIAEAHSDDEPAAPAGRPGPLELVRGLRGAPASVLWALWLLGDSRTAHELEVATAYSDKPVRAALRRLLALGLVEQTAAGGWALAPAFRGRLPGAGIDPRPAAWPVAEPPDRPERGAERLFERIGIRGLARIRVLRAAPLARRPEVVRAWWWYFLTRTWVVDPAGAVVARLVAQDPPPPDFLALAEQWPAVPAGARLEMRQRLGRGWTALQMADAFGMAYPGLGAPAFAALRQLLQAAPDELGPADG